MGAMKVGEASPEGLEEQGQDRRTPAPCAHGGGRGGGRMCRAGHVAFAPEGIPTCLCVPDLASLPVLCVCVCVWFLFRELDYKHLQGRARAFFFLFPHSALHGALSAIV